MGGRRGRIAIVLGPLLALLLLLVTRQSPQQAGDVTPGPLPTTGGAPVTADAVPVRADAAAAGSCPSGNALAGLCGTVAGFSGWYGSWRTAGAAGAFCLEHAKKEPAASLDYTKFQTAAGHTSMTAEDRSRLGYLLGRYSGTTDATTAAALAILVHAAQGDTLTTDQLSTYSTTLAPAVRSAVGSLWAEAAASHGPYSAALSVVAHDTGVQATVTVHSAAGQPMAGFPVSWAGSSHGDEVTTTTAAGTATLTVGSVAPGNTVTAHVAVAGLPADDLAVWAPKDDTVQSVAVALAPVSVSATGSLTTPVAPASLQVVKTTSDAAYVTPAGALFTVTDAAGRVVASLTIDPTGHSNVAGGLVAAAGPFTVTERSPCDQCLTAAPQQVALNPGQAGVVSVTDGVTPVRLVLEKTTLAGAPLAGAVLHIRRASAAGGAFDQDLGTCTSGADGVCTAPGQAGFAPGDFQVTEDTPAPGTSWAAPRTQTVRYQRGPVKVVFADPQLTTVGFRKTDDADGSSVDHSHESLAGAVFAVTGPALPTAAGADPAPVEVGRCTTGADATCTLPGTPLVEGTAYFWSEVSAPPGFALDPASHPFTACALPCDAGTITATDQGRYAGVTLHKHVDGDDSTAVAGATVDLCATGLPDAVAATYSAPAGSACAPGTTWVASGVTDAHGGIDYGLMPPGAHYCAVERTAPDGFQLNPTPVCDDLGAAGTLTDPAPQPLALDLADRRTPPPAAVAPPSTPPASVAPVPTPSVHVLAATVVRPAVRPRVRRTQQVVSPPEVPTAPSLAYTGTEHVGSAVELGAGLVLLGLALLSGASGMRRRPR